MRDQPVAITIFLISIIQSINVYSNTFENDTVTNNQKVLVNEIFVIGNDKTKEEIILRELSIEEGELYNLSYLNERIELDRNLIYNTNLFDQVTVEVLNLDPENVSILINVKERWYIYPAPILRLADRNLMDWILNEGGDFSRINYGLKIDHYNFRGRAERIKFIGQLGFERRLLLKYTLPYIEKTQKHGLSFDFQYNEQESIPYITEDHFRQFNEAQEINRRVIGGSITHSFRPSFYSFHFTSIGYLNANISDTIVTLNPNYLGSERKQIESLRLSYQFVTDKRDNRNYPKTGYYLSVRASQIGLGIFDDINISSALFRFSKYNDLGKGFYLANSIIGFSSFPKNQPYFFYNGLGYDDVFVRGFELNVIEGYQYLLSKNSFRKKIFSTVKDLSNYMPIKQFNRLPLAFYAKFFFDAAYVNNYPQYEINDRLTNTIVYSAGLGIDFVTLYDLVLRFEYSYNSENQLNFALNVKADI